MKKTEKNLKKFLTFSTYAVTIVFVSRRDKPSQKTTDLARPIGQVVKTPPFHGDNRGSTPLWVTIKFKNGPVVQLVRMPACHAGGRGFEPLPGRHFKFNTRWRSSAGRAADL